MELNFDMSKPYFEDIQKVTKIIKDIVNKNKKNKFINEIKSSIQSNGELIKNFPVYFKKVLFPISYERTFGKEDNKGGYNTNPMAIGKWFGIKGWKNISYINDNSLIETLKQDYIDLIPDKDKAKIAQDFFDYSRVFTNSDIKNIIQVPMNIKTTLYKFNWVQIRDMAKKHKVNNNYYGGSSIIKDTDYDNYIYPRESNTDAVVDHGVVSYNARDNTIKVDFMCEKIQVEEIFFKINPRTNSRLNYGNHDEGDDSYIFLSEKLFDWDDLMSHTNQQLHEMFLDDIETLLTPEIKAAINVFIDKQKTIQEDWTKLQMKYAKNVLFKGKV